jgi:hypothetical protein
MREDVTQPVGAAAHCPRLLVVSVQATVVNNQVNPSLRYKCLTQRGKI